MSATMRSVTRAILALTTTESRRDILHRIAVDGIGAVAWQYLDRDDGAYAHAPGWPVCWCGCGAAATGIESDSGDPAAAECMLYAIDRDGESVCACDSRVHDDGQWAGRGIGIGAGWIRRLVVRP